MTLQPGLQKIAIHIFPNISQSKETRQWNLVNWQNMTKEIFLFKNYAKKEAGRPVLDLFIFRKSLIWGESKWSPISIALNLPYNKSKLYKTFIDPEICSILIFQKRVSPPHFLHEFLRKMFLMLHSINWPNFIVWLPLLLEILGNMCIMVVC